ncbi:MAG: ADP-ribosylglycohydrolase family protein [Oligoflexia bacterium]|nr:ADP-ribosylglycohydrolase family protein [Oligoflexia bacterium]
MDALSTFHILAKVSMAFAIGDALGAIFEFENPTKNEILHRFHNNDPIKFTDDTLLILSTVKAFFKTKEILNKNNLNFWPTLSICTCQQLYDWYISHDYRGIGDTTLASLKQISSYFEQNENFEGFTLYTKRGYQYENSAGNGALSRSLPLIILNFPVDQDFCKWISLTHLHTDAHSSVIDLAKFVEKKIIPSFNLTENAKGFYAPETLSIAIRAIQQSKSIEEVFYKSIIAEGDNDSICALSFALWYYEREMDFEFNRIFNRLKAGDDTSIFVNDYISWF